jgi:aspartyl-tRNA(Asn)/glutamyl-tRNA(Gln) amidotransferase subunit A
VQADVLANFGRSVQALRGLGHAVVDLDAPGQVPAGTAGFDAAGRLALPDMGLHWPLMMGLQEMLTLAGSAVDTEAGKAQVERSFTAFWPHLQELGVGAVGGAHRVVHALNMALGELFEQVDVLACPAVPVSSFDAKGPLPNATADGEAFAGPMHCWSAMYPFNFSGHPAAVIRSGLGEKDGCPTGVQFVGRRHADALLLQLCKEYEADQRPFESWPSADGILAQAASKGGAGGEYSRRAGGAARL